MAKYSYLRNESGQIDNPFSKGEALANYADTFFPSMREYYSRSEVLRDRFGERDSGRGGREQGPSSDPLLSKV